MKTDLKAKFLQHFAAKREEEGFTLIELLVVIIIIGILSAIALPSFLNQANKAKESEAKTYVGSMNRGQQAYFTENSTFSSAIGDLGIGIQTDTTNYSYSTTGGGTSALSEGEPKAAVSNVLRGFAGGVWLTGAADEKTTVAQLCDGTGAGNTPTSCGGA